MLHFQSGRAGHNPAWSTAYDHRGPLARSPPLNKGHYYPTLTTLVDRALSGPAYLSPGATTLLTGGPPKADNTGQDMWETLGPEATAAWQGINPPNTSFCMPHLLVFEQYKHISYE